MVVVAAARVAVALVELARERRVPLPSETPEGLEALVFRPRYANLSEYLEGFRYTVAVLQDAAAYMEAEMGCATAVSGESDPWIEDPAKRAARSKPYRPAIYVE